MRYIAPVAPKVGSTVEGAIWITGSETRDMFEKFWRDINASIDELCDTFGLVHSPIRWYELIPGQDRCPQVPDHVQGPNVRLLVIEADIIAVAPQIATSRNFVNDLDKKDLERLRRITRNKSPRPLSDIEVDNIIEEIGPMAALASLGSKLN